MQKILKRIVNHWPILLLILLTIVLRFYKIEELFYFSYDEEIPAFVGRKLILFKDISLLGGATPFGFHLSPFFYWFLAFSLSIGHLNPIIWGWAGAGIAGLTTLAIFIVASNFFGKKVGFTAASFWTFSFLANLSDRHLWALYWGPLVSLSTIYCLRKIIKGDYKFVLVLSFVLSFAIHSDPSNLIFLALLAIVWLLYKVPFRKSTLVALAIIFASFSPIVVFDVTHNFANLKPTLNYFRSASHAANNPQGFVENSLVFPKTFSRLIYYWGNNQIAKNYSYCTDYVLQKHRQVPALLIFLASILLLTFLATSFKKSTEYKLLALIFILYFLGIQLFGTLFKSDIFEHYLSGLFPIFLIILAIFVTKLPKSVWLIFLGVFICANLYKLAIAESNLGLKYKRQAIEYAVAQVGDKPFSLESLSTCWRYGGYRYLFAVFGKEPVKSYVDPNLAHLYGPTQIALHHPATVVSLVFHDFVPETEDFYSRYNLLKSHQTSNAYFGRLEVVVIDNSSGWFDKTY